MTCIENASGCPICANWSFIAVLLAGLFGGRPAIISVVDQAYRRRTCHQFRGIEVIHQVFPKGSFTPPVLPYSWSESSVTVSAPASSAF